MPLRLVRRAGSSFWWVAGTIAGRRIRESTGTGNRALADEFRAARESTLWKRGSKQHARQILLSGADSARVRTKLCKTFGQSEAMGAETIEFPLGKRVN